MNTKLNRLFLWVSVFCFSTATVSAQQPVEKKLRVDELFSLVIQNNPSLSVSKVDIQIAKQDVEVSKTERLPDLNVNASAMYIGDATILDKNLANATKVDMPHFGNIYSFEASQLIWKGGTVKNAIKAKSLQADLASLNYLYDEQDMKLLALGYYLDLYKLHNQADVYRQNIDLAEQRLENINRFFQQGMVTRNDLIRGELQISNLKLDLQRIENNRLILNKQLTVALGLPEEVQIVPDDGILEERSQAGLLASYQDAVQNHPSILMTKKAIELYEVSDKITKAERMPSLALFGGNTLQRPITSSSPALDMYSNGWNVGLSLNFNIASLYKTPKKVQLGQYEIERAHALANEAEQRLGIAVNAAYIKYNESLTQNKTFEKNRDLADENYRIMESKYNNQLAILLDMIDASNTKLDAELQHTNSEINILFAYYRLLKESGQL